MKLRQLVQVPTSDIRPDPRNPRKHKRAQIKAIASVDPSFLLYLEAHGGAPDQQIADGATVDLRTTHGREQFYSSPPATFGGPRIRALVDQRQLAGEVL